MASSMYNTGAHHVLAGGGDWDWTADAVGVLLTTSSYTPNVDHNDVADVTNELSGGNYARLTSMSNRTITQDNTNDQIELNADDVQFPSLGAAAGTPAIAVIYDGTNGTDATRNLIGWIELTTPDTPDGNNYNIAWHADGLWVLSTT